MTRSQGSRSAPPSRAGGFALCGRACRQALTATELRIVASTTTTAGALIFVTEVDPAFGQVVDRQFQRHAVAREDTDVILAHASGRVSANHDAVVERHAVTAVRKYFVDDTVKFKQLFFRHA